MYKHLFRHDSRADGVVIANPWYQLPSFVTAATRNGSTGHDL